MGLRERDRSPDRHADADSLENQDRNRDRQQRQRDDNANQAERDPERFADEDEEDVNDREESASRTSRPPPRAVSASGPSHRFATMRVQTRRSRPSTGEAHDCDDDHCPNRTVNELASYCGVTVPVNVKVKPLG